MHFYDDQKFDKCPHCDKDGEHSKGSGLNPTVAKYSQKDPTVSLNDVNNSTVRFFDQNQDQAGASKTVSIFGTGKNSNPISGWLVCIQGENKGKSFDLHIGKNFVGRSMKSDVIINDPQISRENHFSIIYEPVSRKFFIMSGSSVIHLNSSLLDHAQEMKEDDVIEAGESKFIFIPFCKEGRDWND